MCATLALKHGVKELPHSSRKPLRQGTSTRTWNQAIERYNLPQGGIEITLEGQSTSSKLDTINAITSSSITEQQRVRQNIVIPKDSGNKPPPPHRPAEFAQYPDDPEPAKRRPIRYLVTRSLMALGLLAVIGNIPVYSKISSDTDPTLPEIAALAAKDALKDDQIIELDLPDSAEETLSGYEGDVLPSADDGRWLLYTAQTGDTIDDAFKALKLNVSLDKLTEDPDVHKTLSYLRTDSKLLVQMDKDKVQQLIYAPSKFTTYLLSLQDGVYVGKTASDLFEQQTSEAAFIINKPFPLAAKDAGLPSNITRQITSIFKDDVNFRQLALGDRVSLLFEDFYYQGKRIFANSVLAAEFEHRGTIHQRVRYVLGTDKKTLYLRPDADLELKQVAFNRYPVKTGRLSSNFGYRIHPIFGYRRMHAGSDFAAPYGTPIYATGDGVISWLGRKSGYGKTIEIKHAEGVETLYGHMSNYNDNLSEGDTVKRGDLIGFVGSTGSSTGNHVHYEFRVAGSPEDPLTVALPTKGLLDPFELKQFKTYVHTITNQLEHLRETADVRRTNLADIGG